MHFLACGGSVTYVLCIFFQPSPFAPNKQAAACHPQHPRTGTSHDARMISDQHAANGTISMGFALYTDDILIMCCDPAGCANFNTMCVEGSNVSQAFQQGGTTAKNKHTVVAAFVFPALRSLQHLVCPVLTVVRQLVTEHATSGRQAATSGP